MRDLLRLSTVSVVVVLALAGAGCAEDSTAPPPSGVDASPPPAAKGDYRLAAGGKALVNPAGERIPVDPKLAIGYVDAATPKGDFVDMSGWAAPTDLSGPAQTIVAIAGRKSVAQVAPSVERKDLVEGYDRPGLEKSGFVMSVPVSALECSAPAQGLKLFGIVDGAAARLEWLSDVGQHVADACRK